MQLRTEPSPVFSRDMTCMSRQDKMAEKIGSMSSKARMLLTGLVLLLVAGGVSAAEITMIHPESIEAGGMIELSVTNFDPARAPYFAQFNGDQIVYCEKYSNEAGAEGVCQGKGGEAVCRLPDLVTSISCMVALEVLEGQAGVAISDNSAYPNFAFGSAARVNVLGPILFLITDEKVCANIPAGKCDPIQFTVSSQPFFCTSTYANQMHDGFTQIITDGGFEAMTILWNFGTRKTMSERFATAISVGESVTWTVKYNGATSVIVGVWHLASREKLSFTANYASGVLSNTAWGAGPAVDASKYQGIGSPNTFGVGSSIVSRSCNVLFANGEVAPSSGQIRNYMYFGGAADGLSKPILTISSANFGEILISDKSRKSVPFSQDMTLVNRGTKTLFLVGNPSSVTITSLTSNPASAFSIITHAPSTLAPGLTSKFTIQFDPSQPGQHLVRIDIAYLGGIVSIELSGTGVGGRLEVYGNNNVIESGTSPKQVSANDFTAFGTVQLNGGRLIREFSAGNTGTGSTRLQETGLLQMAVRGLPGQASAVKVVGSRCFSLVTNLPMTLAVNVAPSPFSIKYEPSTACGSTGQFDTAEVRVETNYNSVSFSITGFASSVVGPPSIQSHSTPSPSSPSVVAGQYVDFFLQGNFHDSGPFTVRFLSASDETYEVYCGGICSTLASTGVGNNPNPAQSVSCQQCSVFPDTETSNNPAASVCTTANPLASFIRCPVPYNLPAASAVPVFVKAHNGQWTTTPYKGPAVEASVLFAITTSKSCAETLAWGSCPDGLKPAADAFICSTSYSEVMHQDWTQVLDEGNQNVFQMNWHFTDRDTLRNRFMKANTASGIAVSWTVVKEGKIIKTMNGMWKFSSSAKMAPSKFAGQGSPFAADDGAWGGAQGIVDGDVDGNCLKSLANSYGQELCGGSNDVECNRYFVNGVQAISTNIRNYMYLGGIGLGVKGNSRGSFLPKQGVTFGEVLVHGGTKTLLFSIVNDGTETLFLRKNLSRSTAAAAAAALVFVDHPAFTVSPQPSDSIAPGASSDFSVTFDPSYPGLISCTVYYQSVSMRERTTLVISGTGIGPEIAVTGNGQALQNGQTVTSANDFTDFGHVQFTNGALSRTFVITNLGTKTSTASGPNVDVALLNMGQQFDFSSQVRVSNPDFEVVTQPANSLALGASSTFHIEFNPSKAGVITGTVSIQSNDEDENPFTFTVSGYGDAAVKPVSIHALNTNKIEAGATIWLHLAGDFPGSPPFVVRFGKTLTEAYEARCSGPCDAAFNCAVCEGQGEETVCSAFPDHPVQIRCVVPLNTPTGPVSMWIASRRLPTASTLQFSEKPFNGLTVTLPILFAITDGKACAELLPYGACVNKEAGLPLTSPPFICSNTYADKLHSGFTQLVSSNGSPVMTIVWKFTEEKTMRDRFVDAVNNARGEAVTWTVTKAGGGSSSVINGRWRYSSDAKITRASNVWSRELTTGSVLFSQDDGSWGAAPGLVEVDGTKTCLAGRPGTWGVEACSSDSTCKDILVNGVSLSSSNVQNYLYFGGEGVSAPMMRVFLSNAVLDSVKPTAFGEVEVLSGFNDLSFTITNFGTSTLILKDQTSSSSNQNSPGVFVATLHPAFTVTKQPQAEILPGASSDFTIRFDPVQPGLITSYFAIKYNIPSDDLPRAGESLATPGSYQFFLTGTGIGPEMDVYSNHQFLNSGETLASSSSSASSSSASSSSTTPTTTTTTTDASYDLRAFGPTGVNGGQWSHEFQIVNSGTRSLSNIASLTLKNLTPSTPLVQVLGSHFFSLIAHPVPVVSIGQTTTFRVLYAPLEEGEHTAILSILNDDANESPFTIQISGTGVAASTPYTPSIQAIDNTQGEVIVMYLSGNMRMDRNDQSRLYNVLFMPSSSSSDSTPFIGDCGGLCNEKAECATCDYATGICSNIPANANNVRCVVPFEAPRDQATNLWLRLAAQGATPAGEWSGLMSNVLLKPRILFAITDSTVCAQSLPYGPCEHGLQTGDSAQICSGTYADKIHSSFTQVLTDDGQEQFKIQWDFKETKSMRQRFADASSKGEKVSWTLIQGDQRKIINGTWFFSTTSKITASTKQWSGSAGSPFSADDGIWGAAIGVLNGETQEQCLNKIKNGWGQESCSADDKGQCNHYYINGNVTVSESIRNYLYFGASGVVYTGQLPLHCVPSGQSDWSECDAFCHQSRTDLFTPVLKGAVRCENVGSTETRDCIGGQCPRWPVSCVLDAEFSPWSVCGSDCQQMQTKGIKVAAKFGGPCPDEDDQQRLLFRACTGGYCKPVDCQLAEWGAWSLCQSDCSRSRTRAVQFAASRGGSCPLFDSPLRLERGACTGDLCKPLPTQCTFDQGFPTTQVGEFATQPCTEKKMSGYTGGTMFRLCSAGGVWSGIKTENCVTDCRLSEWSAWTECNADCREISVKTVVVNADLKGSCPLQSSLERFRSQECTGGACPPVICLTCPPTKGDTVLFNHVVNIRDTAGLTKILGVTGFGFFATVLEGPVTVADSRYSWYSLQFTATSSASTVLPPSGWVAFGTDDLAGIAWATKQTPSCTDFCATHWPISADRSAADPPHAVYHQNICLAACSGALQGTDTCAVGAKKPQSMCELRSHIIKGDKYHQRECLSACAHGAALRQVAPTCQDFCYDTMVGSVAQTVCLAACKSALTSPPVNCHNLLCGTQLDANINACLTGCEYAVVMKK